MLAKDKGSQQFTAYIILTMLVCFIPAVILPWTHSVSVAFAYAFYSFVFMFILGIIIVIAMKLKAKNKKKTN